MSAEAFVPAVRPEENPPELTFRALALGAFLGVVFGAASTYLALRVGLTTSASVPIAVLSIWAIRRRNNQRAILEHNIVQTTGSAGESVAAAVVFTVPALIFLGFPLRVGQTTLIALTGGVLGVLMMVPLRRYLIVKEHGVLRYPEGKACAEILEAGEKGGTSAKKVFVGLGVGAAFKLFQAVLGGVKGTLSRELPILRGSSLDCDFAPELLGVGYIIGYRTSLMMVAGSILASFILAPLIVLFGSGLTHALGPATMLIKDMSPGDVWNNYVRHIGAGAVAAGGMFALARALPSIISSIRASAGSLMGGASKAVATLRTERDTPVSVLLLGSLGLVAAIWIIPAFHMNLLGAVLILLLGFLFSVVSSRITGEVGSSSSPLSGMTIGVLMATCGIFLAIGWEGPSYSLLALMVGAVVCIAISNAGTCSQDLKTGYLVGSTPIKQQGALMIGVLTSVLAVGWTSYLLNASQAKELALAQPFRAPAALVERSENFVGNDGKEYRYVRIPTAEAPAGVAEGTYLVDGASGEARFERKEGIGAGAFKAPQARLMSVVIDGLMTHKLPWDLILLGAAIAIFMEMLGVRSLTFAVGVYLPISSTLPVYLGGIVRLISDKVRKRVPDAEDEQEGTLYSSGLIAGASILGIASAALRFLPATDPDTGLHPGFALLQNLPFAASDLFGVGLLVLLGWLMFRGAGAPKRG
jgi:putative OPT family oligopeptide transporter